MVATIRPCGPGDSRAVPLGVVDLVAQTTITGTPQESQDAQAEIDAKEDDKQNRVLVGSVSS